MMQSTVELLKELIAIPSYVEGGQDEREMVAKMESVFAGSRYTVEKQVVSGERANLFVHDGTPPQVILLGHMDTVPPKADNLGSPFEPREVDGELYGLGSIDMKAGVAIAAHQMLTTDKKGLAAIFSVDEEYDCAGAMALVEKYTHSPKLLINLEGSDLKIQNGCRGITEFLVEVIGKAAHAAHRNEGVNAIEKTALLVSGLQTALHAYDVEDGPVNSVNIARLNGGNLMRRDEEGNPIFSESGNIVPSFVEAHIEVRTASKDVDFSLISGILGQLATENNVTLQNLRLKNPPVGSMFVPPSELKDFEDAVRACGLPVKYRDINTSGYYEAQILWAAWGCPVVVFGPGPNGVSHQANEHVNLDSVAKAEEVVAKYLEYMLTTR